MHPTFLYQYVIELQRERENDLLNLTEEQRLIRKTKLVKPPLYIKLPHINLLEMIRAIDGNLFLSKKAVTISSCSEQNYCTSCRSFQTQDC